MARPMHLGNAAPGSWLTVCLLDRANVHWTTDLDRVTCTGCRPDLAVLAEPSPVSLESRIFAVVVESDWFRAQQETVYDEAVRDVAHVDPAAIHNPYRKEP